jgi:hypothetical protein
MQEVSEYQSQEYRQNDCQQEFPRSFHCRVPKPANVALERLAKQLLAPTFDALRHLRTAGSSLHLQPQFRARERVNVSCRLQTIPSSCIASSLRQEPLTSFFNVLRVTDACARRFAQNAT